MKKIGYEGYTIWMQKMENGNWTYTVTEDYKHNEWDEQEMTTGVLRGHKKQQTAINAAKRDINKWLRENKEEDDWWG